MQARGGADDSRTGNVEALEGPFPAVKLRGLPFSASQDEIRQFLVRLGHTGTEHVPLSSGGLGAEYCDPRLGTRAHRSDTLPKARALFWGGYRPARAA